MIILKREFFSFTSCHLYWVHFDTNCFQFSIVFIHRSKKICHKLVELLTKKTTYDLLLSKGVSVSILGLWYFEGLPAYCSLIASNCFFIQFVTRFLDVQCCTLSSSWIRHFNTQLYPRALAYSTLIGSLWACQSRYLGLSVLPPALIIKLTNWRQFFMHLSCCWSK